MPKILVVAPNWIGDCLMAQPLLARIHERDPQARIDVLAPGWVAPVLRRMSEVAGVIETPFAHGALDLRARWTLARTLRGLGYDEGLLLDVDGFVAEGAGENIFIVKDGRIYEPELTSALTGITRSSVIELAAGLGYTVESRRVTRDDIYIADECFFTGTAAEVTPIRELDGRQIGAGRAGPVTKKLQKAFFDVVTGKDRKHRHWLTRVDMTKAAKGKPAPGRRK